MKQAIYTLYFICLSILFALGTWQWSRGTEKAALESLIDSSADHYITIDRAPTDWRQVDYRRVRLTGTWEPERSFLLDNRTLDGRAGFEVFSPFRLQGDQALLLVNRGWIGKSRQQEHGEFDTGTAQPLVLEGQLYMPRKGFTLGAAYVEQPGWPKVVQYFDAEAFSGLLSQGVEPAVLVLGPEQPAAFQPVWEPYVMDSRKHYGYAVQWWGLAATLAIFGIIWYRRSQASDRGENLS